MSFRPPCSVCHTLHHWKCDEPLPHRRVVFLRLVSGGKGVGTFELSTAPWDISVDGRHLLAGGVGQVGRVRQEACGVVRVAIPPEHGRHGAVHTPESGGEGMRVGGGLPGQRVHETGQQELAGVPLGDAFRALRGSDHVSGGWVGVSRRPLSDSCGSAIPGCQVRSAPLRLGTP